MEENKKVKVSEVVKISSYTEEGSVYELISPIKITSKMKAIKIVKNAKKICVFNGNKKIGESQFILKLINKE